MRTFVAINIPVEQELMLLFNELKKILVNDKVKWVDFSTLHLTLFFLGSTEQDTFVELRNSLSNHLGQLKPFTLTLKGIGTFGAKRNPKVIWVGVEPSDHLKALHSIVEEVVVPLGFQPDERGFNPHITLGRIKQTNTPEILNNFAEKHKHAILQQNLIGNVVVYKSDLMPSGPVYSPLFIRQFSS